MQKILKQNGHSILPSLQEMIEMTKKNSNHNSFVYFTSKKAKFHIAYPIMWHIWIRLSEGPWRPNQLESSNHNFDIDEVIKKNIENFFINYVYNWSGNEFEIDFSKQNLHKIKKLIIDTFVYNTSFNNYIDNVMNENSYEKVLSFNLEIKPSLFDILTEYSLIPLTTIDPEK